MRRRSFSTVPQLITNIKEQLCVFSITETARREKESHEHRAATFRSVLHHMNLHAVHTQEKSGVSTNRRQMIPCVRVFVSQPCSENWSLDLFCTFPTPLTLLRALLSSIPSLFFFLHCALARHLPLYFLLIISVYPLDGLREAALESPPAHKAAVFFYITPLTGNNQRLYEEKVFLHVSQTKTGLLECKWLKSYLIKYRVNRTSHYSCT